MHLQSVITLIYKKGDPSIISNYRPIALLNTDFKILQKLLNLRLKPHLLFLLSPHQYVKPTSSASHCSIVLRDLYQYAQYQKTNSFYVSLDFKKAFDSISYNWLIKLLHKLNFPHTFINYIASIQKHATSTILVNGTQTEPFSINRGVHQGDPLSLTLFTLAINALLEYINTNKEITPSPTPLKNKQSIIAYADDLTLTITNQ